MKRLFAVALLTAVSAGAQDLSAFEKILFPVLAADALHGANGTVFQTRLLASLTEPVAYYPATANGGPSAGVQPAGVDFVRYFEAAPRSAGRLLYFDRTKTSAVSFFYELDVTGPDGSVHRTTLPVVRERNFERGPSVILGLTTQVIYAGGVFPPTVTGFNARNHIRVYDVDNTGNLSVHVRVTNAALLAYGSFAEYEVPVSTRDGVDASYPYYVDIALPDLCITAPNGNLCHDYSLDVSIEPSDSSARYWAFASATSNTSGETSVFYPQ